MKKLIVFGVVFTFASAVFGWGGRGHDDVARLCGQYMPTEVKTFLGDWNDKLQWWCHYPDMTGTGWSPRRYMDVNDLRREIGGSAELFVKMGVVDGNGFHLDWGRAVTFMVLRHAFETGNSKLAAFCISVLSHAVSDQGAFNHAPILQFVTYSKFNGVKYNVKHSYEFTLSNKNVAKALHARLALYKPKALGKTFEEAIYEKVFDSYRQGEVCAETEVDVAFGTKAEHDAAMAKVVAAQIEAMLDVIHTAWVFRKDKFEMTKRLIAGLHPREEVRRRRGDVETQAVYKGIFDESLNPKNPKAAIGIVCEPYGSFHVRALSYVGKMLVASAGRTLRDGGYAIKGIPLWNIEKAGLPSPEKVPVVLIAPGRCKGLSGAVAKAFGDYRKSGGRIFVMAGQDPQNFAGLKGFLKKRENSEVPVSSKWGYLENANWQAMNVSFTAAMTRSGKGPFKFVRNPNFDGFCKPCCIWSLNDDPAVLPLARLDNGKETFTIGGIAKGVCWMPEYLFLPFLFSSDKTADWKNLHLDSFASKVLLDAMEALLP